MRKLGSLFSLYSFSHSVYNKSHKLVSVRNSLELSQLQKIYLKVEGMQGTPGSHGVTPGTEQLCSVSPATGRHRGSPGISMQQL